jgi:hypothetical protein
MRATHEHEFEAALGLPEQLPKGEHILWQDSPNWKSLGVEAFQLRSLSIYFALMLLLQLSYLTGQGQGDDWNAKPLLITGALVAVTLGALWAWAYMSAKASMYTITNKRVVMRIGVVFSLTFNLPLKQIIGAHELHRTNGTSDLSLSIKKEDRIGWLHLWPHSRPWALYQPQPTLRCIGDGVRCAEILKSAWLEANKDIKVILPTPLSDSTQSPSNSTNGLLQAS